MHASIVVIAVPVRAPPTPGTAWRDLNGNGVWDESEPIYSTIQGAVTAASAGETIYVEQGTYTEALYISESLTIRGASKPIIRGSGSFTTNYGPREAVIFVENAMVVLENLDIEGEGLGPGKNYGVIYEQSSGTIRDCIVSPNTVGDMVGSAVGIWDYSNVRVEKSTVRNFGRIGVFYFLGCSGGVYESTIIGQVYGVQGYVNYGIEVEAYPTMADGACNIEIIGNDIYSCDNTYSPAPTWISAGIYIDGWKHYMVTPTSTVIVRCNNIHDNYIGIGVAANPLSSAHFNNIFDNRKYGVVSDSDWQGNYEPFDALYNWWGYPSGPYHSTNPSGTGNPVSDYVNFDPWLKALQFQSSSSSIVPINSPATLTDNHDLGVQGATIRFSSDPTGLTFTPNPQTTDINGYATVTATTGTAGIYLVTATVCGAVSDTWTLVVYDPAGMTAGGGWYYPLEDDDDPMPGTASFGFVAKYIKGNAQGNLEFQYHVEDKLNLKSTTITWLVVSGSNAQFKGTATLNGVSGYYFRVWAHDGGAVEKDTFSIKIWYGDPDTDGTLIHSSHNDLAGGNIIVRTK